MLKIISDIEIDTLVREPKRIPNGLYPLARLLERNKHRRRDFSVQSAVDSGNEFVVLVRQSMIDVLNFSAILGYKIPELNTVFRLRRYNGLHFHTNPIEREMINDFHIHFATERYQRTGPREDTFAIVSQGHSSLETAIRALLENCGFNPPSPQLGLHFGA